MEKEPAIVRKAKAAASAYPEYGQILNYLTKSGYVPPVVPATLPEGVLASYVTPGFADPNYKQPVIELDSLETASRSPKQVAATLIHELTHASQSAMRKQARSGGKQFVDAWRKLYDGPNVNTREMDTPLANTAKKLDATWVDSNKSYRSTPSEIQAFGVGNSSTKTPSSGRPPAHLDATAATEFMILLDLAVRDQLAKEKK